MDQKICPKCQSIDVDASGICLTCGFGTNEGAREEGAHAQEEKAGTALAGMIEMDYSSPPGAGSEESPELPQWRLELSRRLQEIKQKREAGVVGDPVRLHPEGSPHLNEQHGESASEAPNVTAIPVRAPRRPPRVVKTPAAPDTAPTAKRQPAKSTHEQELPLFQPRGTDQVQSPIPFVGEPDPKDIQDLIDSIIARQGVDSGAGEPVPSPQLPPGQPPVPLEDRLILVSRTLSGLVDLIVVTICTGACIIAADVVSGISIFDWKSLIVYSLLLAAMFISYSVFFLGTANQTIGMMLTNLKVVSEAESRPGLRQLFGRCLAYLLSLSLFGLGLLWGLWDRKGQCLHDRLSHTLVVRL